MGRSAKYTPFVGMQVGFLTVLEIGLREDKPASGGIQGHRTNRCKCVCGKETFVRPPELCNGTTTSCGCRGSVPKISKYHQDGRSNHYLYMTHYNMLLRCYDPQHHRFPSYGARGIEVTPEWHEFWAFATWIDNNIGIRPEECTIDRIDNNGNYEPNNVRWATRSEQERNKVHS